MDQVYKKLEVIGSSKKGIEDAINTALERTSETVRNMRWFEVAEIRGYIEDNKVSYYQVALKIGFIVEEPT